MFNKIILLKINIILFHDFIKIWIIINIRLSVFTNNQHRRDINCDYNYFQKVCFFIILLLIHSTRTRNHRHYVHDDRSHHRRRLYRASILNSGLSFGISLASLTDASDRGDFLPEGMSRTSREAKTRDESHINKPVLRTDVRQFRRTLKHF